MSNRSIARRRFCAAFGLTIGAGVLGLPLPIFAAKRQPIYPDLIGRTDTYLTKESDTLLDLARQFGLGFTELIAANPGIDPWVPGEDTKIVIPDAHLLPDGAREGLVLNLADQRIYYYAPNSSIVESHPIGIGNVDWETPKGTTRVIRKRKNPIWRVPKSIRAEQPELPAMVMPGPKNPLGKFALDLSMPAYLIHGTNKPLGVGRRVSHGCIRLYPEDILTLFRKVAVGTPVAIVDQPAKLGWHDGELYLEVHTTQSQADELEATGKFTPEAVSEIEFRLAEAAGDQVGRLEWDVIRRTTSERRGIPIQVLRRPQPRSTESVSSDANRL